MDKILEEPLDELQEIEDLQLPPIDAQGYDEEMVRRVRALYAIISDLFGVERLVLKASKTESLELLRSDSLAERVIALQKLVYDNPTIEKMPSGKEIPVIIDELEDTIADIMARRSVEEEIECLISEKMQERQEEYLKEIKKQILSENPNPENAQTLKKLAILEKKNSKKLSLSAMEILRPQKIAEIVGQEQATKALLSKLAAPFPQHIILYGPPGVGKTSAARIALEASKQIKDTPFNKDAPFVEVNGATLRWDPRDVTNPLLGSVHDPIYQGARKELAETGIPEPKLGLVSDAHSGVLFIDEIGEMDPLLLSKLLKVLEDKRVYFDSSYYDCPGAHGYPDPL